MPATSAPPAPLTDLLLTGEFRSGPRYFARRPRGTGDYLLILTIAGAGRFTPRQPDAAEPLITPPGGLALYAPGAFQDYRTHGPGWRLLWVHFIPRVHWLPWLHWPSALPGLGHLHLLGADLRSARRELAAMHTQAASGAPGSRELAMTSLERALLIARRALPSELGRHPAGMDPRIARAIQLLAAQPLTDPVNLPALARSVGLSLSRLQHLFREQTGKTLLDFREDRRLDLARRLLAGTTLSVKEVADQCGYASPFYFSLRFKRAAGKSPQHWREAR